MDNPVLIEKCKLNPDKAVYKNNLDPGIDKPLLKKIIDNSDIQELWPKSIS